MKNSLSVVIGAKKSSFVELKPVPSRDLVLPVHPQEDNARGGALVIQLKICFRARFAQMNGQTVKLDHVLQLQPCPKTHVWNPPLLMARRKFILYKCL